jgi:hypothetical protein
MPNHPDACHSRGNHSNSAPVLAEHPPRNGMRSVASRREKDCADDLKTARLRKTRCQAEARKRSEPPKSGNFVESEGSFLEERFQVGIPVFLNSYHNFGANCIISAGWPPVERELARCKSQSCRPVFDTTPRADFAAIQSALEKSAGPCEAPPKPFYQPQQCQPRPESL